MSTLITKMVFKKSTKNTHVYESSELTKDSAITSLYVNKSAMINPQKVIIVTIEGDDNEES